MPAWARQREQNEKKCTAWLTATVARRTQAGSRILLHRTLCETVHRTELHEYSREVDREDEGGLRETPKWTITSISMMHRFRKKERRTHQSLQRSAPSPSPTSPHTLRNHHRNSSAFPPDPAVNLFLYRCTTCHELEDWIISSLSAIRLAETRA